MNRNLKGLMAKFDITYQMLARWLNMSTKTVGKRINEETFTQNEIKQLTKFFQQYDCTIEPVFFLEI